MDNSKEDFEALSEYLDEAHTALKWSRAMAQWVGLPRSDSETYEQLLRSIDTTQKVMQSINTKRVSRHG